MSVNKKIRPHYMFLPKRDKNTIDQADVGVMLEAIRHGEYETFYRVIRIVQHLKHVCGVISQDH